MSMCTLTRFVLSLLIVLWTMLAVPGGQPAIASPVSGHASGGSLADAVDGYHAPSTTTTSPANISSDAPREGPGPRPAWRSSSSLAPRFAAKRPSLVVAHAAALTRQQGLSVAPSTSAGVLFGSSGLRPDTAGGCGAEQQDPTREADDGGPLIAKLVADVVSMGAGRPRGVVNDVLASVDPSQFEGRT